VLGVEVVGRFLNLLCAFILEGLKFIVALFDRLGVSVWVVESLDLWTDSLFVGHHGWVEIIEGRARRFEILVDLLLDLLLLVRTLGVTQHIILDLQIIEQAHFGGHPVQEIARLRLCPP